MTVNEHRDLWHSDSHIELQLFEFKVRDCKKTVLVNAYRTPSGRADVFVQTLTDTLDQIRNLHEYDVFVMGDFNLPYNQQNSASFRKLKGFKSKFGFRQLITKPTRYSTQTANILDLIFTNCDHILHSDTWETSFSDHQPIYLIRKKARTKAKRTNFCCRTFNNYVKTDFQQDLVNHNWSELFEMECPEQAWSLLYDVFLELANKHCLFKEFTSKKELPEWLTKEILEFLKERDYKYKVAKHSADPHDWIILRKLRNKCNRLIANAKNEYVLAQLQEHSGDVGKFWKVINSVFTGTQKSTPSIKVCDPDTGIIVPDDHCPNFMNNHLTTAGPKLANQLPDIPFRLTFNRFLTTLKFKRITVEETFKQIEAINVAKSSAIEDLSSRLLKDALACLPIHLTYIFNLSIEMGEFPSSWKNANVILIPKDGSKTDPNNYRPISLLPLPGKMLEKLVHHRLFQYINSNSIGTAGGFPSRLLYLADCI